MDVAALVAWVLTAGGGFVLFGTWVARGGPQQARSGETRLSPSLIGSHLLLAAIGLVLWIAYVASDADGLAWTAFAVLLPVALLGFAMLFRWAAERRSVGPASLAAEQRFPVPVVVLHGVLAVTTVVLVVLAAAGLGG